MPASVAIACRALLVAVFAIAAAGKLRRLDDFVTSLPVFGLPASRAIAVAVVAIEAGIACGLVAGLTLASGLAAIVLAGFTAGIVRALRRSPGARCRCFGARSAPLARSHVVRNGLLCAAALIGCFGGGVDAPAMLAGALVGVAITRWDDVAFVFSEGTT